MKEVKLGMLNERDEIILLQKKKRGLWLVCLRRNYLLATYTKKNYRKGESFVFEIDWIAGKKDESVSLMTARRKKEKSKQASVHSTRNRPDSIRCPRWIRSVRIKTVTPRKA